MTACIRGIISGFWSQLIKFNVPINFFSQKEIIDTSIKKEMLKSFI